MDQTLIQWPFESGYENYRICKSNSKCKDRLGHLKKMTKQMK